MLIMTHDTCNAMTASTLWPPQFATGVWQYCGAGTKGMKGAVKLGGGWTEKGEMPGC